MSSSGREQVFYRDRGCSFERGDLSRYGVWCNQMISACPTNVDSHKAKQMAKVTGADVDGTIGDTWIWFRNTHTPPSIIQNQVTFRNMMISCIFQSSTLGWRNQAPALCMMLRLVQRVSEHPHLTGCGGSLQRAQRSHKLKILEWECWRRNWRVASWSMKYTENSD